MITVKLPYKTENKEFIQELQRQSSCIIRYAYNRFWEGKTEKEIRLLCKSLNHVELLNSWMIQCAIKKASYLFKTDNVEDTKSQRAIKGKLQKKVKKHKSVFGGKYNFNQYSKGKITKEQFEKKRLMPIISQGEKLRKRK